MPALVPVGTVIAWPGPQPTIPTGWLLCNGDQISRNQYPDLCDVLQDYWGAIAGVPNTFHRLPDLRGVFLRGVNIERGDSYADEDAAQRETSKAGAANDVGSMQGDLVRRHRHDPTYLRSGRDWRGGGDDTGDFTVKFGGPDTGMLGGSETRPKNAYVHWIIRALP